jgi:hypothetical protein
MKRNASCTRVYRQNLQLLEVPKESVAVIQSGAMLRGRTVLPLIVSLLAACQHTQMAADQHTQTLPHRNPSELFPQANSPAKQCPGQHADYVVTHDGTEFFLECWGTQTQ